MEPDWPIEEGHVIRIVGSPGIRIRHEIDYPSDLADLGSLTANPAVNAIAAVVAAPGLVTIGEMPLITAGSVAD